ncbi:MAG: pyridoxal-dependent decarboxylase, partial [Bacteroidota bacterium]
GMEIFGEYVDTCYALAQTFAAMIQAEPQLELAVEPQANIVCFRFVSAGLSPDQLDALNREIRVQIVESGTFYIVQTQLRGRHYLRTTFMQAYTQEEDLQQLIALVCETGKKLTT